MSKPLTAVGVAKLKAGDARREIPDAGCPGLYLVIQPSGSKSWALRFRRPSGKTAKLVLGSVYTAPIHEPDTPPTIGGHLTLAAAHRLATELRHQIALGRDPAAAHIQEKRELRARIEGAAASTFAASARDYVGQYASKRVRRWKETARLLGIEPADLTLMQKGLAERWAARPVADIDGHDIHTVVDEARKFGIPGLEVHTEGPSESRARKVYAALSGMFAWLLRQRRVTVSPCASVSRPEAPQARDRVLSDSEIAAFWRAASEIGGPYGAALKLLSLTGCRLNEVAAMRWAELSEDGVWAIPGARTKNHRPHIVPLAPLARDVIAGVQRIEGCLYVFTASGRSPLGGWSETKARLDAAMGDVPHWVLHDLRRTFVTGLAELGVRPDVIELAVNHAGGSRGGIAGVYNRSELMPERRAALERWAAHVEGLVAGRAGNVVPMVRA